jgi:hypothetical protein
MTLAPAATDNPTQTKSSYNAASHLLYKASFAILGAILVLAAWNARSAIVLLISRFLSATGLARIWSHFECMQEQLIMVDWKTTRVPRPFVVVATQNPIELEGTFPLLEAQLYRFLLKVKLGYPSKEEEANVLVQF